MRTINRIIRDTQQVDPAKEKEGLRSGKVTYHYLILQDGQLERLADENDIANHTRNNNVDSIGIGLMHVTGTDYPQKQLEGLSELLGDIVTRRKNIPRSNILAATEVDDATKSDFPNVKARILAALPAPMICS